ncbi:MAG: hypothetical protein HY769_10235 [Candidatus Stahlbacteria bacterium]|nr:hypothetical protein [Candidatus Stahlbacteria bacterium]
MSIILFILLSIPDFNFNLLPSLTREIEISWNKGFISYYQLKDGVIVRLEVKYFSTFQDYLSQLAIASSQGAKLIKSTGSASSSTGGIIPVIDIPVNFPKPVASIIGQGGQIDVSGSQRIEFGGSRTQNFLQQQSEYSQESWFPTLEMQQRLGVNLKGTIGEKIHVFIDHNSEREFDLKNTIRLEYIGNEDEIVQSIKAGNTDLSLPGVVLIGGATSHKGLFGIKSESKIGPINITAIASREEAETQHKVWKGGGVTEREAKIDDISFVQARFLLLVPPKYVQSLQDPHNIYSGNPDLLPKQVCSLTVYLDKDETNTQGEGVVGKAFDIPNWDSTNPGLIDTTTGRFIEKHPGTDNFYLLNTLGIDAVKSFPILELNSSLSKSDLLAIEWIYKDWNDSTITIGRLDTLGADTLRDLQILKRERMNGAADTSYISWWYELKNIYSVGGSGVSGLNLKVFKKNTGSGEDYEVLENTNITYRKFMGLEDASGRIKAAVFDSTRGIIIFPSPYPFVLDTLGSTPVDSLGMESDKIYHLPNFNNYIPKYYIWVQYKGVTTEYALDIMNVIEGSEEVKINGQKMQKGVDYEIDYETGWIKFKTPSAADQNAEITVDFQYVPMFMPTAKNLLGTRMQTKIGELGELSSALLYYSTSSMDFRPTFGSEPGRIILGEAVANISTRPEWITKAIDKLPFIETETPSSFTVQGNVGFSLPNPNTRGEVYLDDMEGVRSVSSLGISRAEWSFGSIPGGQEMGKFAHPLWYNPRDGIPAGDLYPYLPDYKKTDKKSVLKLAFPAQNNWRFPDSGSVYWSSLQTCLFTGGQDFSQDEYLEVWVKGDDNAKLHIDIGTDIPEDAIRRDANGTIKGSTNGLDTEDKDGNNILDIGEDNGIDGIDGTDGTLVTGDDGNDDYYYNASNPNDYSKINGTEGNSQLDGEDLDRNQLLNQTSNYFAFTVDMENDTPTIEHSNGWKFFRIPLIKGDSNKVGLPQWECIKYARIWVDSISKGDSIEIAAMDIVGTKSWRHEGSEQVKIRVKNNEEDLDYFTPPSVVIKTDQLGRKEKEQSLVLTYTELDTVDSLNEGGCYTLYTRARNFIQYQTLKFWVREKGEAKVFIRVGGDNSNYYEYRTDFQDEAWHEIEINLEDLAQLKLKKSTTDTAIFVYGNYRIRGNPSFTNIGRVKLGVINEGTEKISGEIWIDELRLTDPRRESGVAANVSISTKMADFADISLSYRTSDPYFQNLSTFTTMREAYATNSNRSLNLHSGIQVSKLFPSQWGIAIPLDLGITRTTSLPKYQTGSDIILTEEQTKHQTSNSLTRTAGISLAKSGSKNRLLRLTLDNLSTRVSYRDAFSNAFTTIDTAQSYSGSMGYGYAPKLPAIKIRGMEIRYYPQRIDANTSYSYSRARGYRLTEVKDTVNNTVDSVYTLTNPAPPERNIAKGGGFSYIPINPLSLTYSMSMTNDLNLEADTSRYDTTTNKHDTETGRGERVGVSFSPSVFGFLSPKVNYATTCQETHTAELGLLRNVSNTNSLAFDIPVNLNKSLGIITRLRDENKDSTAKKGTPQWILMQTEKLSRKLHIPSLSYSIAKASQFYSLSDPPDYKYRWGIADEPENWIEDGRNGAQISWNYGISRVGFSAGLLTLTGGWSKTIGEAERMNSITQSVSTKYPQMDLSISGLERFITLNKWFNSITTSVDYTTNWNKSGQKAQPFTSISQTQNYGLGVQSQWKRGISLNLSSIFNTGRNETVGAGTGIIESKRADYSLQGGYTFRAPKGIKIPLLSRVKWTSDLNFALTTSYSTDWSKNVKSNTTTKDTRSISILPQLSYNFSTAITGGANMSYTQNWYQTGTGNTRSVGVRFFAEFSF